MSHLSSLMKELTPAWLKRRSRRWTADRRLPASPDRAKREGETREGRGKPGRLKN